jgi:thioredoxin reductase (NADPH)
VVSENMSIDFLIIGGGPAGIAAAIQAARLGLSTTIIEKDRLGGQALAAPWVENYPGFPDGITGKELMSFFQRQLEQWPVKVIFDEVKDLESYNAKSVLLAAGLTPRLAGIQGEIPYGDPDRIEHAEKKVLVVGGGDSAFDLAWSFAKMAASVTIGMRGDIPRALPKLIDRALSRNVRMMSLRATAKQSPEIAAASTRPRNDFFKGFDLIISCIGKEAKHPLLEKWKKAPGLFMAGDICHGEDRHIAIAVGDGIAAAQAAYRYLKQTAEAQRSQRKQ